LAEVLAQRQRALSEPSTEEVVVEVEVAVPMTAQVDLAAQVAKTHPWCFDGTRWNAFMARASDTMPELAIPQSRSQRRNGRRLA